MDEKNKQLLDQILKYAAERKIQIPADIVLKLSTIYAEDLYSELKQGQAPSEMEGKILMGTLRKLVEQIVLEEVPEFGLMNSGLVPAPGKAGLMLMSTGWKPYLMPSAPGGGGGGTGISDAPGDSQSYVRYNRTWIVMPPGVTQHNLLTNLDYASAGHTGFQPTLTGAATLALLLPVDGAGSLLDADLLDGNHAAAFALSGHLHAGVYEPADATILKSGNANWIDLTDGGATTLHTHAAYLTAETDPLSLHLDGGNKLAVDVLHTNNYDLTVPATGTVAELQVANVFTTQQMIDGTSDQIQLRVQGHSTQTNVLQTWENSSGTVLASVDNNGCWGLGIAPTEDSGLIMEHTWSTAPGSSLAYGLRFIAIDTATINEICGIDGRVYSRSAGGINNAIGAGFAVISDAGYSLTYGKALVAHVVNTAGTIAVGYGFYVNSVINTATMYGFYGLYIEDQTAAQAGNNYAIGTNKGLNRLGDQLSIVGWQDVQQLIVTGHTTQTAATPFVQFTRNDAAAGISAMLGLTALGSGADGDGGSILYNGKSSTTAAQAMGLDQWLWVDATHASRKARRVFNVYDTAIREGLRIEASGTAPMISFLGAAAVAQQANTVALDTLLVNYGLRAAGGVANFATEVQAPTSQLGGATNYINVAAGGIVTLEGTAGITLPHLMQSDNTDQAISSAVEEQVITFDTDDHHKDITRTSSSRFTITKAGSYLVTFSAVALSGVAAKQLVIWMKKNGANVASSATYYTFKAANANTIITVTFLYHFAKDDYFEFWMYGNDTGIKLDYTAAVADNPGVTPAIPACPSIIMTANYVSYD